LGTEDTLIATKLFGKLTLDAILEGYSHYARSFHRIMMVSDIISWLTW